MSRYSWKAVPEVTWAAFALAFAGLVGSLMVAYGAPENVTVAVTTFIGAGFRMLVALLAAITSSDGTVSTGVNTDPAPIPPSP